MTTPTIKTHESDELASSLDREFCGICRRQISRYTCPSCNLFYCSLNCFRSEAHSKCSETFYRKEIEIGVKSGPSKTEDDRKRTIEMLKRIEDQGITEEDWLSNHSDKEDEEDSLACRLSAIDISSAPADDLLRLLTKQERDKFFGALKDPSSELAQQLLESTELEKTRQLPWWGATSDDCQSRLLAHIPYGAKPGLMAIPTNLVSKASDGISLLYNICATLLAYAYVTRRLSISPLSWKANDSHDQREARRMLSQSVPFLVDHKSKLRHVSMADAVISFWSRIDSAGQGSHQVLSGLINAGQGDVDHKIVVLLLQDVVKLVRPRRVTVAERSSRAREGIATLGADHPFATTIMAISDIGSLFDTGIDLPAVPRQSRQILMKLTFYAAHVLATPSSHLHTLADEADLLSKSLDQEARSSC